MRCSGSEIAGCPVTLNGRRNVLKRIPSSGPTPPTGRGSQRHRRGEQDRAGAPGAEHAQRERLQPLGRRVRALGRDRRGEHLPGGRLHLLGVELVAGQLAEARDQRLEHGGAAPVIQCPANSGSSQSGVHSSTSCPSETSRPAASWAAATHSGSTSTPSGADVHSRIRSGCGGTAAGSANGGCGSGGPSGVDGPVAREHVERERGVAHRAGEHAVDAEALERGQLGPERDAEAGRLEADDAAAGGRDADRAAGVVAVRHRDHAGRDGGGAAAGGAAGDQLRVPRVARRAVALGLGDGPHPPLGRVRLADHDRAGRAQPRHRRRVDVGRPVAERRLALVGAQALREHDQVLDRDRHAGERARVAGPIASASARARSGQVSTNALSPGSCALDRGERGVDQLARAQPALADERGLLGGAARERVEAHRRSLPGQRRSCQG